PAVARPPPLRANEKREARRAEARGRLAGRCGIVFLSPPAQDLALLPVRREELLHPQDLLALVVLLAQVVAGVPERVLRGRGVEGRDRACDRELRLRRIVALQADHLVSGVREALEEERQERLALRDDRRHAGPRGRRAEGGGLARRLQPP